MRRAFIAVLGAIAGGAGGMVAVFLIHVIFDSTLGIPWLVPPFLRVLVFLAGLLSGAWWGYHHLVKDKRINVIVDYISTVLSLGHGIPWFSHPLIRGPAIFLIGSAIILIFNAVSRPLNARIQFTNQTLGGMQFAQVMGAVAGVLIGAGIGFVAVLVIFLANKFKDIALAIIGLVFLVVLLTPGVGGSFEFAAYGLSLIHISEPTRPY